ncbi:MAG: N-6 DNA methylase [Gemmatimonadales bacterium]|jgi:hypothetical protein|nr:N-6 DNA methylase [Gemmatimonadales bacterium]
MRKARQEFATILTEGGLLPSDFLQRLAGRDKGIDGLDPDDYHLAGGQRINEAANRSWLLLLSAWERFQREVDAEPTDAPATRLTRERWLLPLFQELGYGRLGTTPRLEAEGADGTPESYPVSHLWGSVPIHLVGSRVDLDTRTPGVAGAARMSPHGMVQQYLNASDDHLWAFVSNGRRLRLLRDNHSLTRQAYVEFDLEEMMNGPVYADFQLLWMLCHESRVEHAQPEECWLERWRNAADKDGTRALDQLRQGVEKAINILGTGFIQARTGEANRVLRARLQSGELDVADYYRQLLRLVYRLLFLFVAEDRDLLHTPLPDEDEDVVKDARRAREVYAAYYSTSRLRDLAARPRGTLHPDLWRGLRVTMALLHEDGCPDLALPALGSFLWDPANVDAIGGADIANRHLLEAVHELAFVADGKTKRRIDYRNLASEELGSVYEALLELHPEIQMDATTDKGTFHCRRGGAGSERKTTGSYYTPDSLVQRLLDSALEPVIHAAVRRKAGAEAEQALLELTVVDPASGSGHFLIAAAHRLAKRLAAIRGGETEPSPVEYQRSLRDIIRNCIYGVDVNPMAVELCKVSLWMESLEPGRPLGFLDHRIRYGNSLVGMFNTNVLNEGIPPDAYKALSGDDRETATRLRNDNRSERGDVDKGQLRIRWDEAEELRRLAEAALDFEEWDDDSVEEIAEKEAAYSEWRDHARRRRDEAACDLWVAAFHIPKTPANLRHVPTTQAVAEHLMVGETAITQGMRDAVANASAGAVFFHWPLEFPRVFHRGGFDVVLSNPPWERVKLQEQEFFAVHDAGIAAAATKAIRGGLIKGLADSNPALLQAFEEAKHDAEASSQFLRTSGRYAKTGVGDVNTYAVFAGLGRSLTSPRGRAGIIVPTGIATDNTYREFFAEVTETGALASLYDFENREKLFEAVDSRYKFSLLTLCGEKQEEVQFAFFLTQPSQLSDKRRRFTLTSDDFARINPNTRTCPIFRTRRDAEITRKIYENVPVLVNEGGSASPWGVVFRRIFDLNKADVLEVCSDTPINDGLGMYEAKMIHQFDHRWASYKGGKARDVAASDKSDPMFSVAPRRWVGRPAVVGRLRPHTDREWLLAYRDIARVTDERTVIMAVLPYAATDFSLRLMFPTRSACHSALLIANFNSLTFDFVARQMSGGTHVSDYITKQLPCLPPDSYTAADTAYIVPRVVELVYSSWELGQFAADVGTDADGPTSDAIRSAMSTEALPDAEYGPAGFPPFGWDANRRATIRAELDAYYAKLYDLARDELEYILDPHDVEGDDFPGETFRVLKEKEIKLHKEYRTKRLVLEAWDRLE